MSRTISWTWSLSARAEPDTACFIAVGLYSESGTQARATAYDRTRRTRDSDRAAQKVR